MNKFTLTERNRMELYPKRYSHKFKFCYSNILISNIYGGKDTFPAIQLRHIPTNIVIQWPGYERYLTDLLRKHGLKGSTLNGIASDICMFLNYFLHHTNAKYLYQIKVSDIKAYLEYAKGKRNNRQDYIKLRDHVFDFLCLYYESNKNSVEFKYDAATLKKETIITDKRSMALTTLYTYSGLNVNYTHLENYHKKNRVIDLPYKSMLLKSAYKHDRILVLPMALQNDAGLREGEVVNLSLNSIKCRYGGFGRLSRIEIDLTKQAVFFKDFPSKTDKGAIKKFRVQRVYDDFNDEVKKFYDEHISYLSALGNNVGPEAPLLVNKWGRPMSVQTYSARVKALFYNHFLPELENECSKMINSGHHYANLEIYQNEYPGAHMFRHWFTMYLLVIAKKTPAEVSKWRGDSSLDSINKYIHENQELIDLYKLNAIDATMFILKDIEIGK